MSDGSPGLRNAIYGMLAGQVSLLLVAIYYAGQFESRLAALERQTVAFQVAIDRINDAREKTDIHMTQMDDRQIEANSKIGQILQIVQELEQGTMPAEGSTPPPVVEPFSQPAQQHHTGH